MNWELICWLLKDFSILKTVCNTFLRADDILMLEENSPDLENRIYVAASAQAVPSFSDALVIFSLFGEQDPAFTAGCRNYIFVADAEPFRILNTLLKGKNHLEQLVRVLAAATSDQEVLDAAGDYLQSPLFYFDASYRILAITRKFEFPSDPEWIHMLEKGFLSTDSIKLMQDSGDLDLLADKVDPFPYKADIYPFESLVCNIRLNDQFYSRLNMLCIHESPTPMNIEECRIICSSLDRIARSCGNVQNYTGPLDNMVMDLLKGVFISEELISDRLRRLPNLRNSLIRAGCVEIKISNDPQILKYYASLLRRYFSKEQLLVLEFENKIVLVMHAPDEDSFASLHDKLNDILISQGLRCGISNIFDRFNTLRDHYLQAQAALSFNPDTPGICLFHDIFFDYMLSFLPAHIASSMISPKIINMLKLQEAYQFSLIETLKQYLKCGCNLQKTAGALFIHKNTALYRLNHIREILHTDLDDPEENLQLLLSIKILEKYPVI